MRITVKQLKKLIRESLEETLTTLKGSEAESAPKDESVLIGGEEAKELIRMAREAAQNAELRKPGARRALLRDIEQALMGDSQPQNESAILKNVIRRAVRSQLKK